MSASKNGKFSGARRVNSASTSPISINEAIAQQFSRWSTNFIARRLNTSVRTVENWRQGRTGPQAKHVAAILSDEILAPAFLVAIGRADIADLVAARDHLIAARQALDSIR
jgi:hypothetical protein